MQDVSVRELFEEQIRRYSHKDQYKHSPLKSLIVHWLKNKKNKRMDICEFGGGAGQLLGELQKAYPNNNYTNVEIVDDYKKYLVSKKINFVVGSVLYRQFPHKSFDVIIMRDVLHHLVGRDYQETQNNQKLALKRLKQLVRPEGIIFIEELTNESEVATQIIYFLSRLNSKIGIHIPSLFISSHVIVAFLTSSNLLSLCNAIFGKKNIKKQMIAVKSKWYINFLHLFSGQKKVVLTIMQ